MRVSARAAAVGPFTKEQTADAGGEQVEKSRSLSDAATIDSEEIRKFETLARDWWSPTGPLKGLHDMNAARVHFIRTAVAAHYGIPADRGNALHGLTLLDVGCGGGILAEPLARIGAEVTGIDVTRINIGAATAHAQLDPSLQSRLKYRCVSAEEMADSGERFDVVVASEVVEHVTHASAFCATLARLARRRGCVVITTINRTPAAYAGAIVAAERVLGLVPVGTHAWDKFVTPVELQMMFDGSGFAMHYLAGMHMNALTGRWQCGRNTDINYAAMFAGP